MYSNESSDHRPAMAALAADNTSFGPADANPSVPGVVQKSEQADLDDTTSGHRVKVNEGIFKLLKAWGTPGADRFRDGIPPGRYFFYPEIPGEPEKNARLPEQADQFQRRSIYRSGSMNTMQSGRPSLDTTDMGGIPAHASGSRRRSDHVRGRSTSGASLTVPDEHFGQELNNSPYSDVGVAGTSSSSPTASTSASSPSTISFPPPVRQRAGIYLTVPPHQETLPPRAHRADTLTADAARRRPSVPVPAINIVCVDCDSEHS